MERVKYYVTTPIYYVNDKPHIGHAYTTILADVLARYHRLMGIPTFFLTGTDEHGQKVQRAAEREKVTPQQQADNTVVRFRDLWAKLLITHDDFIRTTEPRHVRVVQEILQDLYTRGEIYRAEYDGWYCVACERFFTEKDLVEGRCPEAGCGRPVERLREANYFFRMSRYQEWLIHYIQEHPRFIQPAFRRNETLGFLRNPLNDLCVSRPKSRLSWGIELPFDRDYVTYVWFDALVNYISAIGYRADDERFRRWWPASCHLIGKDILTTHTVYWPTMLRAMGLPMPETIFAHGWWLLGQDKMSKSAGNVVDPMAFVERTGPDAFRYFLMAEMTLGQDASFTEEAFVRRYNADLANDLGNMLNRVMKLIGDVFAGQIPAPEGEGEDEAGLREAVLGAAEGMLHSVSEMRLDLGLARAMGAVREGNRYLERNRPWELAKEGQTTRLGTVLYTAAEALRILSGLLDPVMPSRMPILRKALGLHAHGDRPQDLLAWGGLKPGLRIGGMISLFPRLRTAASPRPTPPSPSTSTAPTAEQGSAPKAAAAPPAIELAEFQKVDLRTARVIEAERVPGTTKLLRLRVDAGGTQRQIVAGIAEHYAPESLVGKIVVIVANLKPARIRGLESEGMLLAASDGRQLCLLTTDRDLPAGAPIR